MSLLQISKNYFIDTDSPIADINDVIKAFKNKEALYHKNWGIRPVAVLLHMQMISIYNSIERKMLFKIIKK